MTLNPEDGTNQPSQQGPAVEAKNPLFLSKSVWRPLAASSRYGLARFY